MSPHRVASSETPSRPHFRQRAAWALRGFFGLLLLTTALGKLLDNRGFAEVIATYQFPIPEPLLLPLGLSVSLLELGMAGAIFAGIALRPMALLTILMHLGYTGLALITNLRGLALENCGCFGVFLARPMTWFTVVEDAALTLLAVGLYVAVRTPAAEPRRASLPDAHGPHESPSVASAPR